MPTMLAALIFSVALQTAPVPEYQPVGVEAYTLDLELDGYVNGAMDPARLMTVNGCTLERDAAYTYSLMLEAAERDGIHLRHESCYRTFNQQAGAYNLRCPHTEVPTYMTDPVTGQQVITGIRTVRVCSGPPTAPPGVSNHGWGRAVDFRDGWNVLTCWDDEYHWLKLNAHRFGWVHPPWAYCGQPTAEPWHWEFAGVTDPTPVNFIVLNPLLLINLE